MPKLTIERLKELVLLDDRESLCREMAPLSEAERKSLAPEAIKLASNIENCCSPSKQKVIPDELKALAKEIEQHRKHHSDWRSPRWASQLLLVGLADMDVLKNPLKHDVSWARSDLHNMQQRVLQVLDARRPKWLAEWIKWEFKQESPIAGWYLERGLIRSGALPPNDSPEYYARMALEERVLQGEFYDTHDKLPRPKNRRAMLEADPDLFKHDIWRLLETDTIAFRYAHFGWPDLLLELCQAGKLDRGQLLARCVHGMSLPLSVTTLGGLVKFHDQLSPSNTERQTLLPGYLQLLHQNHPGVVSLAISSLDKLHRAELLPVDDFLKHLPAVFTLEKKGAIKSALKLADMIDRLGNRDDNVQLSIAKAVVGGLQHADADVQSATLELLRWRENVIDAELAATITAAVDSVASAVKSELKKLIAKLNAPASAKETTSAAPSQGSKGSTSKKSKTKSAAAEVAPTAQVSSQTTSIEGGTVSDTWKDIPELIRQRARLGEALQAAQQGGKPVVLPVARHHPPRRDPSRAIQPIADADELIATVSSVMHDSTDVMQLERCLDGIARLRATPPDAFEKRSAALHKAVSKRLEKYHTTYDLLTNIGFMSVVANWLEIPAPTYNWRGMWHEMRYWFLRARCDEVRHLTDSVPLLALPTHRDGWIDPDVFVTRISHYAEHHILLEDHDLAQALLRLTPDGRAAALKRLGKPDYYNGGIDVRYALGDDVEPEFNWRMSMVQLAAVRARMVSLAEQGYQPALPIAQARLDDGQRIVVSGALTQDPTVPFSLWEQALSYDPTTTAVLDPQHPYSWLDRWESLTNPLDHAADCLAGRTPHLLDPEATWTPEACRLAILAASHERNEARIETTDAILEAITRLLVIPEIFGRALAVNLQHVKFNRVAKVLSDVARASPLHHWIILQTSEACITHLESLPTDIHLLLSLMLDSAATLEIGIDPATQAKLSSVDAKSKGGKLVKQLQKITTNDPTLAAIHTAIVKAAGERAQRWQSLTTIGR